jgi:hypothetical protein
MRPTKGCVDDPCAWSSYDRMIQGNMTSSFGLPCQFVPCQWVSDYAAELDYSYVAAILEIRTLNANDLAKTYESSKIQESASAIVSPQVTVIWRVPVSV